MHTAATSLTHTTAHTNDDALELYSRTACPWINDIFSYVHFHVVLIRQADGALRPPSSPRTNNLAAYWFFFFFFLQTPGDELFVVERGRVHERIIGRVLCDIYCIKTESLYLVKCFDVVISLKFIMLFISKTKSLWCRFIIMLWKSEIRGKLWQKVPFLANEFVWNKLQSQRSLEHVMYFSYLWTSRVWLCLQTGCKHPQTDSMNFI